MPSVEGVVVPMVTPFTGDSKVDVEAFEWLARRLVAAGVNALFPNSTTGEFVHLTMDEASRLVRVAVAAAPSSVMVLPGVSSNRTDDSVAMAREFVKLGADGVIVLPPFFFRSSEEVMRRHFEAVASAVDVPVVIYNNPLNTGVNVPVRLVAELAREHSNVVAAKVTSADFAYLVELIREVKAVRRDFRVLTGLDYMTVPALAVGGDGVVGGLANIVPEIHVNVYALWKSGDLDAALRLNAALMKLSELYWFRGEGAESPAVIKGALEGLGAPVKRFVRAPLSPLSDEGVSAAASIAREAARMAEEAGVRVTLP